MFARSIQNSVERHASGGVERVLRFAPRGTVSSLRRITRIALFNTSSKPDSGLILSLAKPPTGTISIDIALHYGDVAYGNIGSGNRLDFTAVGRDVNILSRLELLCKDVGRPLLMTDTFAVEVAEPVIEIGHFELRGFRRHQAVYALCQEGEQPCRPKASLARA